MMNRAEAIGLNNAASVASLCLAVECKLFPEDSVMFLNHLWIFSISKFAEIETVPSSMHFIFPLIFVSDIFFFPGLLM